MISIIVPVYNVEKYIHRCIDSIISQTFSDFELILIDDGSPDNCGKICDEYAEKDSRVVVLHQNNQGQALARNNALDYVFANNNSEWIAFIDSDDWIHSKYLETLYFAARKENSQISACGFVESSAETPKIDENKLFPTMISPECFYCEKNVNAIVPWGKLYQKVLFQDIRFPDVRICEDEYTIYKVLFKCKYISFINQPLYAYFKNRNSVMNSNWSPEKMNALTAIEGQILFFRKMSFRRAYCKAINIYAYKLCGFIDDVSTGDAYIEYAHSFRKRLRVHLRRYKKDASFSIKTTPWYYEYAYPNYLKLYWRIKSIKEKIGKKK